MPSKDLLRALIYLGFPVSSYAGICLPIVSIVVPFFGLTNFILRILKGNPKKELQWRLLVK